MVRRKRQSPNQIASVLGAVFCLILVFNLLKDASFDIALGLAVAAVVAVVVFVKVILPERNRKILINKAYATIDKHGDQLARSRAQLVRPDAYGKPILDKWIVEKNYFINQHIAPSLTIQEQAILGRERAEITQVISQRIEQVAQYRAVFETFSDRMTPVEFESFCAEQLRRTGWDAHVTRQSRDQGVDVIAEKDGLRIVLQCKLYSNPVGNKAVQEAVAGKAFERAKYCAVVSNSSYTSAAEQLASTNGVLLLHYSELKRIETLFREAKV